MRKYHCTRYLFLAVSSFATIVAASAPAHAGKSKEIRIVLAGDSTVTDKAGWGGAIGSFFKPNVKVINFARSGRSSKSFINEGHLKKAMAARPDYLFIQFGHNDCPGKGPKRYTDPNGSYMDYLKVYIKEARKAGAKPILLTPMTRRHYDEQGKMKSILTPYAKAVLQVGKEEKVPVIDLYTGSVKLFERLGESGSNDLQPKGDRTHFNAKGAKAMAKIITEGLKEADTELAKSLKKDKH
ncbi:MAG: rhamnogalacturonan acetylesterase [Pirellulales bacterium]|nr:rhamnogalacturonan acetylesterase [Pirellulales bacterium]